MCLKFFLMRWLVEMGRLRLLRYSLRPSSLSWYLASRWLKFSITCVTLPTMYPKTAVPSRIEITAKMRSLVFETLMSP